MSSTPHTFEKGSRNLITILEQAVKFDNWGQRLEASQAYQRFCDGCEETSVAGIDEEDQKTIRLVTSHARRRMECLQLPAVIGATEEVNAQQMGADIDTLNELACKLKRKKSLRRKLSSQVLKEIKEGGLLPPLRPKKPGFTYLTLKLDKIGLKDAMTYVEPFITVSLKDANGADLSVSQSTAPAELYEEKYIIFNEDVHVQKPVDEIHSDCAIMFEFKHFKAKKNKVSTKCFAVLEKDEIKNGRLALELYQKPVDYTRKRLSLLTEKKLFLHVSLVLQKVLE